MQSKSLLNLHNNPVLSVNTPSKTLQSKSAQHVPQTSSQSPEHSRSDGDNKHRSFLVDLPDESLGHIVTYIDTPSSLIALSQVNRRLRNYVTDDNTWYRSFAYQYWGTGPECYPSQGQKVMLRRSENTWKKEFIKRHELLLRWEKSRSTLMSYQPHFWSTTTMHLMDNMSLMTASLQYGVVARSFPLTGKNLRGFLDASGTANGFGIGNPNAEFSPHVSCIAVSSRGGTALVAWGFRSGEIALTTAPRVMDSDRPAARYLRSRAQDEHPGQVQSLIFTSSGGDGDDDDLIFTGCARGQIKAWDTKRLRCLWSGTTNQESGDTGAGPNPCVKLAFLATAGVLVAGCQNGDLVVWLGFQVYQDNSGGYLVHAGESVRILRPCLENFKDLTSLLIDPESNLFKTILLVHYTDAKSFLRYDIDNSSSRKLIFCSRFNVDAEESLPITSLKPCFGSGKGLPSSSSTTPPVIPEVTSSTLMIHLSSSQWMTKRSFPFIMTGNSLGYAHVWNWDVHYDYPSDELSSHGDNNKVIQSEAIVRPFRTWEAYEDCAVSSLEANDYIIVTGSSNGCIKVWDVLTLNLLRAFLPPVTRPPCNGPVGQIFVRDDLLVANIGARVLVWQAKPLSASKKIKVKRSGKPRGKGISTAMNRWQQQIELMSDIKETKQDMEAERTHINRVNGRVRAEQMSLDGLGLTEAEAVDYLLMLSREEEERKRATSELVSSPSLSSPPAPASSANISSLDTLFVLDGVDDELLAVPDLATDSGRQQSDLMTWNASSPPDESSESSAPNSGSGSPASSLGDCEEFPSIGSSPSSVRAQQGRTEPISLVGSWSRGSPIRSWRHRSGPSPGGTAASSLSPTTSSNRSRAWTSSPFCSGSVTTGSLSSRTRDEEDEELRFVLELSLAEAKSRCDA